MWSLVCCPSKDVWHIHRGAARRWSGIRNSMAPTVWFGRALRVQPAKEQRGHGRSKAHSTSLRAACSTRHSVDGR